LFAGSFPTALRHRPRIHAGHSLTTRSIGRSSGSVHALTILRLPSAVMPHCDDYLPGSRNKPIAPFILGATGDTL